MLDGNGLGLKDGGEGGVGNPRRKMVIASNPDDSNDPIVTSGNCPPHFDLAQRGHLKKVMKQFAAEKCSSLIHLVEEEVKEHKAGGVRRDHLGLAAGMWAPVVASTLPSRSSSRASFPLRNPVFGPPPKSSVVRHNPEDRTHRIRKKV